MDKCCKCHQPFGDETVAAWDGNDNEVCWPCFGKWGWNAFPVPPTPKERHDAFLASMRD